MQNPSGIPLEKRRCVPCEGGMHALTLREAEGLREQVPGWDIHEKFIERTFKFSNFVQAMDFANRITRLAEEESHHPDLHISWGKVRVDLSTHAVRGLSANDFILAAKINQLRPENRP